MKYILLHADFTGDIPTCTVQCPCSRVEHVAFYGWDALNCRDCGKDIQRFPPMDQGAIKKVCYMCDDDIDPNETPFDEDIHMLCIICARKMEKIQDIRTPDRPYKDSVEVTSRSSVDALRLSNRVRNILRHAHIETIGQLVQCTECDMLRINDLGRKSLRELRDRLADVGLGFSDY